MARKQAVTIEQRVALRKWAHFQHPRPSQKQCIEWFLENFGHRLSQSTVSESLSKQYANLEASSGSRSRTDKWPDLEKVLVEWQRRIE
jgi:beta-lactamase class D